MTNDHEECRRLIAGLIDGELTPEERMAANECLRRSAQCRREYEELLEVSPKLQLLPLPEPESRVLEKLWRPPYHRLAWKMGLWLVLGTITALLLYGAYEFSRAVLTNSEEPLLPRIAIVGLVAGGLLIFYAVLRERIQTYKVDRYKEIER